METQPSSWLDRPVGDLVSENFGRAAAFTRLGIDFCCGGKRTVGQACASKGISPEVAIAELEAADRMIPADPDEEIRGWPAGRIASHITEVHHSYVRQTLPVLRQWSKKVARVHGEGHPELLEVTRIVEKLETEMERHMNEEEGFFPTLTTWELEGVPGETDANGLLDAMEDDHKEVGALVARAREITAGFKSPDGACATYRATFALLKEFEGDLHRHVHLENNLLFPRVRQLLGTEPPAPAA